MLAISILEIKDNYEKIKLMDNLKPDFLHLDIMDGIFVPNIVNLENLPKVNSPKDVHLMVQDIEKYIEIYSKLNPEYITFHIEAANDVNKIISIIRTKNIKVGISIKPNTEVSKIVPYLGLIDLVLVMSVEPGKGGQSFLENSISKIKELYSLRKENNYNYIIEMDGGINETTLSKCLECDLFVVGSYITSSDDFKNRAEIFK